MTKRKDEIITEGDDNIPTDCPVCNFELPYWEIYNKHRIEINDGVDIIIQCPKCKSKFNEHYFCDSWYLIEDGRKKI